MEKLFSANEGKNENYDEKEEKKNAVWTQQIMFLHFGGKLATCFTKGSA